MNRREFLEKGLLLFAMLSPFSRILGKKGAEAKEVKDTKKIRPLPAKIIPPAINIVVVGDRTVGKTCLINSYVKGEFFAEMPPAVLPPQTVNEPSVGRLRLIDTSQNVNYTGADVVVVCYPVISMAAYNNACRKWRDEVRTRAPNAVVLLCGTKTDLRSDAEVLKKIGEPLSYESGRSAAQQYRFDKYVECSALNQAGIKSVFHEAARGKMQQGKEGVGWLRPAVK